MASPVLKYLLRRFNVSLNNGKVEDKYGAQRQKFLIFAVENRLYDVFFELSKDSGVWNHETLEEIIDNDIHDSFYFDCYNDYVYDNPATRDYMLKKMTALQTGGFNILMATPGGAGLTYSELSAWVAVCIHRKAPEAHYAPYLSQLPKHFLDIVQAYVYKYSLITFDEIERNYYHSFIDSLLNKYFGTSIFQENSIEFAKLLNDIRFGNVYESVYTERILSLDNVYRKHISMLIMAASKSNNKALVKQLLTHPEFSKRSLKSMVERKSPHSFKVYFDIIEGEPLRDMNSNVNYANPKLILAVCWNKFKLIRTITTQFGAKFEIQSPSAYTELGFASKYEIVLDPENQYFHVHLLIEKMFNDAANAGAQELTKLITEHCNEQIIARNEILDSDFRVSYEVIQLLLEHQELIQLLANRFVTLTCDDKRINQTEIATFRHVINPFE